MAVTKEMIKGYVEDLVTDFLYYDRKEDEDLPSGAIEKAVKDGVITTDDIIAEFSKHIKDSL